MLSSRPGRVYGPQIKFMSDAWSPSVSVSKYMSKSLGFIQGCQMLPLLQPTLCTPHRTCTTAIHWISLNKSSGKWGSVWKGTAQQEPGFLSWEGREITKLHLGKWLWLQGWPSSSFPCPIVPIHRKKQNSSTQRETSSSLPVLGWSSTTLGRFLATRLPHSPSTRSTVPYFEHPWKLQHRNHTDSACSDSNPWNITLRWPAQSFYLLNPEGISLGHLRKNTDAGFINSLPLQWASIAKKKLPLSKSEACTQWIVMCCPDILQYHCYKMITPPHFLFGMLFRQRLILAPQYFCVILWRDSRKV